MRLTIKLLNQGATINSYKLMPNVEVMRGETAQIIFQLWDTDANLRYIPPTGSTVQIALPFMDDVVAGQNNTRTTTNIGIDRAAAKPFAGDDSIWSIPLTAAETAKLASASIKVTLTEPSAVRIAFVIRGMKMLDQE